MKKPALMAAVAAVSLLAAVSAQAAGNAAAASGSQQQIDTDTSPIRLDASTASVIPDNTDIRGQVTAHRSDSDDTDTSDDDEDKGEK
jgi:hypothetical protein